MTLAVAVVAAGAAVVSAVFVFFQVREMQSQTRLQRQIADDGARLQREISESAAQPYIWADVRLHSRDGWTLEFVVGNSGPTVATNVRVQVDPPFPETDPGRSMAAMHRVLRDGLASLTPGRTFHWSLGGSPDVLDLANPLVHRIMIECDGPFGPVDRSEYVINMKDWRESLAIDRGSMRDISKAITKLAERLPDGSRPVRVEVVDDG